MLIGTDSGFIGRIEPISANIRQQLNGEYSCEVSIPLEHPLAEHFNIDALVQLEDANGTKQTFRLEKPTRTLEALSGYGWHITQDLANDLILNRAWLTQAAAQAWPELLQAGISERRFTGTSDIATVAPLRIVRMSVLQAAIGGQDNSFVNRFGGELERNNFTVNLKSRLGADRGYRIAYKKNLTGLNIIDDAGGVVNRIVPTFLDAADNALLLPETYIDSNRISQTAVPHVQHIHFGDIKVGAEAADGVVAYPSVADAETEVRARVAKLYESGVDQPVLTVEVQFVELRNAVEYKDYALLETVNLGDTVRADYESYTVTNRVVAYDWDATQLRYNGITLGTVRPSIDAMTNQLMGQIEDSITQNVSRQITSTLATELATINEQVSGALGYHTTTIENADGSKYTYMHDKPALADSLYISYAPEPGTYVWTDTGWNSGNPVWQYGATQEGNAVYRLLSTVGLNAEWINTGSLYISSTTATFAEGYDPTTKETPGGAESKVDAAQTALAGAITTLETATQTQFDTITRYIRFVDGQILLGETGNEITLTISNDRISFKQNNAEVAYISDNKLYIVNGQFVSSIRVGDYAFTLRTNGSLSFGKVK